MNMRATIGAWLRLRRAASLAVLGLALTALAVLPADAVIRLVQSQETAKPIDVDVALVLAVDISLSMDPDEQRLQREGYIAALRDEEILKAIRAGQNGRIAVTYVEWAGPDIQLHLIPWRVISDAQSAEACVAELAGKDYCC